MPHPRRILLPLCLALCVPSMVLAQGPTFDTFTISACTAYGVTGAEFIDTETTFGPDAILIGDRGNCTLQPPAAGCGTGTFADPYRPDCGKPLGIASSTSGTAYQVVGGETNYTTNTLTLVPIASVQPRTAVPLNSWVAMGSGLGIVLLTLLRLRRIEKVRQR